jgi:hypothetical protein
MLHLKCSLTLTIGRLLRRVKRDDPPRQPVVGSFCCIPETDTIKVRVTVSHIHKVLFTVHVHDHRYVTVRLFDGAGHQVALEAKGSEERCQVGIHYRARAAQPGFHVTFDLCRCGWPALSCEERQILERNPFEKSAQNLLQKLNGGSGTYHTIQREAKTLGQKYLSVLSGDQA